MFSLVDGKKWKKITLELGKKWKMEKSGKSYLMEISGKQKKVENYNMEKR